jgi:hypothetical protein
VVIALPYLSKILPEPVGPYLFPPLGDIEGIARLGAFIFSTLTTYLVFICAKDSALNKVPKRTVILFVIAVALFLGYFSASYRFIRVVSIPSEHRAIAVSVGFERTDFARRNFSSSSDIEMLRDRGLVEEEIERLWTVRSLLSARLTLYLCYLGCVMSLVGFLSFGALQHALEGVGTPRAGATKPDNES